MYFSALVALFTAYPEAVIAKVCDPRTGIAGTSQWLPTIAEVRHACEVEMAPIHAEGRRENRRRESEAIMAGADEKRRLSFAELKARYPDVIGHSGPRGAPPDVGDRVRPKIDLSAPLTVSDELRQSNAANAERIREASGK